MRILLDECLPRRLKRQLSQHEVTTAVEAGLSGKSNGELLRAATSNFDVFITIDQNLVHQQKLSATSLTVIILSSPSNRFASLQPLIPAILQSLETIQPGIVIRIP